MKHICKIAFCIFFIVFLFSGCNINEDRLEMKHQSIDMNAINPNPGFFSSPIADLDGDDLYIAAAHFDTATKDITSNILLASDMQAVKLFELSGQVEFIKKVDDSLVLLCNDWEGGFSLKCFNLDGHLVWDTVLNFHTESAEANIPAVSLSNDMILVGALVDEEAFITRHYLLNTQGEIIMTVEQDALLDRLTYYNGEYYCTQSNPSKTSISYIGSFYVYNIESMDLVKIDTTNNYALVSIEQFDRVAVLDTVDDSLIVADAEAIYSFGPDLAKEKFIDVKELGYTPKKDEYYHVDKVFVCDGTYFVLIRIENHERWYGKRYLTKLTDDLKPNLYYLTDMDGPSYISDNTITFLSYIGNPAEELTLQISTCQIQDPLQ